MKCRSRSKFGKCCQEKHEGNHAVAVGINFWFLYSRTGEAIGYSSTKEITQ